MIDKIEKSLIDRIGSSIFITLFLSFLFTVIFQPYVSKYSQAFLGFFLGKKKGERVLLGKERPFREGLIKGR